MLSTLHAFRNNTRDFISYSQGKKIRSRTFSRFENACYSEEIPELIRTWGSHYSEEQKRKKWINYNPFLKARIKKANTSTETLLCWKPKGWTAFVMYTFCVCVCQWIQISSMSNDFSFLLDTCHPWSLMLLSFFLSPFHLMKIYTIEIENSLCNCNQVKSWNWNRGNVGNKKNLFYYIV